MTGQQATNARRWADAVTLWAQQQRAQELSPGTISKRLEHVRHFREACDLGPWSVAPEDVELWVEQRRRAGWAPNTVRVHRSSLAAFYRWAVTYGHATHNPCIQSGHRALRRLMPAEWQEPVTDYTRYLRGIGRTEATITTRANAVRRFAEDNPSLTPATASFDDIVTWMGGKRWAAETRKLHRDALRGFFRWMQDAGRRGDDPARRVPPIRGKGPAPRPVVDEAYHAALAKADRRERIALRLAAELGLRRAEVAQVHSRDIVGSQDSWSLVVHGKGAKDRILPLSFTLANMLRALPAGYAFPGGDHGHISAQWLGKLISDVLPAGVSMHALRHRFATKAYNVDRDVFTVQQLLGHASPATTQRYVQVSDARMRALVETVSA